MNIEFDPLGHRYTIDKRRAPSVTQVLGGVFRQDFHATQWHLDRGQAVHGCAAFIAQGKGFTLTPETQAEIGGQVEACRKWFRETGAVTVDAERMVAHPTLMYAGTLDLLCVLNGVLVVVDWKASITQVCQWQLGAYAACLPEKVKTGFAVQLCADGNYKTGGPWDMVRAGREFGNIRSVYGMMERERLLEKEAA